MTSYPVRNNSDFFIFGVIEAILVSNERARHCEFGDVRFFYFEGEESMTSQLKPLYCLFFNISDTIWFTMTKFSTNYVDWVLIVFKGSFFTSCVYCDVIVKT